MSLENRMLYGHLPSNWQALNGKYDHLLIVHRGSQEFEQVEDLIQAARANRRIAKVTRVQNCNFYCQFLCRREYFARTSNHYYSVRRFIQISPSVLMQALSYNLDPRRLGLDELVLQQELSYINRSYAMLIVNVLTTNSQGNSKPKRNTDYYIEYVVYFA